MAEEKSGPKAWTDAEKLDIFIQIAEKVGTIPWDEMTLPEGRTRKACTVMFDRERQKVKKAREAEGKEDGGARTATPKGNKKRKAEGEGTPAGSKKGGNGRKKAVKAGADGEAAGDGELSIKAEEVEHEEI